MNLFEQLTPNTFFLLMFMYLFTNRNYYLLQTYKYVIIAKTIINENFFIETIDANCDKPVIELEIEKPKYEDKYLDKYNNLSYDYYFTSDEKVLLSEKIKELESKNEENYKEQAADYVFNEKIKNLQNSYVMENTPLGNVIMTFNSSKNHFEYYSDSTIPYRYLEIVARKFVITFKCKQIFINMEDELKSYEETLKKIDEQKELEKNSIEPEIKKKTVFAKLKSYNKDVMTGRITNAIPPKNHQIVINDQNKKAMLKEKSNSYNHQGKINNFSIIKKIDKTIHNKKLKLSFLEYKQLMNNNKIT